MRISKCKWFVLFLANIAPALIDILLYRMGSMDDLYLFVPFFGFLTFFNYCNCDKVWQFLCMQLYMIAGIVCSNGMVTQIYYQYISNDFMTPVVGVVMIMAEAGIGIVTTVVVAVVKAVIKHKK